MVAPRRQERPRLALCPAAPRPSTTRSFSATAAAWVGEHVETSAEANLALGLLDKDLPGLPEQRWLGEIAALAKQDRRLLAKLRLRQLLTQPEPEKLCQDADGIEELFALLHESPLESFRLRARAINTLDERLRVCRLLGAPGLDSEDDEDSADVDEDGIQELGEKNSNQVDRTRPDQAAGADRPKESSPAMAAPQGEAARQAQLAAARQALAVRQYVAFESDQLLRDFIAQARLQCTSQSGIPDDLGPWENLTQDIYSVGLLARARDSELYPEVVALVACVHHRRALAPQRARPREPRGLRGHPRCSGAPGCYA